MKRKGAIDWSAVHRAYVETSISVREIARRFGISEGAIRKRRDAGAWARTTVDEMRENAEKALQEKIGEIDVSDIDILVNTYKIRASITDGYQLAAAAQDLAPLALAILAHLAHRSPSDAVRRQSALALLEWGFGKPIGIADRSKRPRQEKPLGKKEALHEAANNPDQDTEMGRLMARRAAATRQH